MWDIRLQSAWIQLDLYACTFKHLRRLFVTRVTVLYNMYIVMNSGFFPTNRLFGAGSTGDVSWSQ